MVVSFRHPQEVWDENPSFLLCTTVFQVIALLSLIHAIRSGPRALLLWISAFGHGLVTEAVSYLLPDIDCFWHSQSMVMFLNRRLPLYVSLFYPTVLYTSNTAVDRLGLTLMAHPFAVALADLVIDIPYDIMGIKLLWWTWHDTDPNVFDRSYSVPWTSYIYHLTFASSFSFLFIISWKYIVGDLHRLTLIQKAIRFWCCVVVVSLLSMPLGVLQFIPLYNVLHYVYDIHTEVITFIYLFIYGFIVWSCKKKERHSKSKEFPMMDLLSSIVFIHFMFYIILVLFVTHPEELKSTGLHEPIGNCSSVSSVMTPVGMSLPKKTFLCPSDYNEPVFDWHCLPNGQPPSESTNWYTLCGTKYHNHAEYVAIIISFCLFGLLFFREIMWRSNSKKVKAN